MRGKASGQQAAMFTLCVDDMISADHPLRRIKGLTPTQIEGAIGQAAGSGAAGAARVMHVLGEPATAQKIVWFVTEYAIQHREPLKVLRSFVVQ
jgi:hypothetical protein